MLVAFIFAAIAQMPALADTAQVNILKAIEQEKWTQAYKLAKATDDPLMMNNDLLAVTVNLSTIDQRLSTIC